MNRMSSLLLITLILALAACGGDGQEAETDIGAATAAPSAIPPTLPPPVISEITADDEPTVTATPIQEFIPLDAPWPASDFGYGVQVHGNATVGDSGATMNAVRNQLGLDWVKVQIQWWLIKPSPDADQWFFYDNVIQEATANNLHLLLSVVGAPEWTRADGLRNGPPDDYSLFAEFLRELINRYPGQIHAIEVWNEQNLDREWTTANGVSPEDYVTFLQTAYQVIKELDPNIIVISGALSPTGPGNWINWADDFEYLDRALAAGMLTYADCVGVHHNGYNIPPDVPFEEAGNTAEAATAFFRGPFTNPHHSWSFKTTLDTYAAKVRAVDPNKKLCVTEFGWASSEGYDEFPETFDFALDNTLQEQAEFIVQAFQQMHDSGNVWLAFLFNFDFGNRGNGPTDDPVPYSIIDTQGIPRPAFDAVADMEKRR